MAENYWTRQHLSRRKVLRGAIAASSTLSLLAAIGCNDGSSSSNKGGGASSPSGGQPAATATTAAQPDLSATLRAGISADLGSLDPQSIAGVANIPNVQNHFNFLFSATKDRDIVPNIASFKWAQNNTALDITALPGVTFHNGEPFNAEQIKFNLDRALERTDYNKGYKSGRKGFLASITGEVVVVDAMTVRANVKPDVGLPGTLQLALSIVPKGYVTQVGDDEFARKPVGTGAFAFASRTPDSEMKSVRFDKYFRSREQSGAPRLPYVANLVQSIRPDDQARLAALEAGEIDIAWDVDATLVKAFDGKKGFRTIYSDDATTACVQFNTVVDKDPVTGGANPWRDIRVRKAVNMAVDVHAIIKKLYTGTEKVSFGGSSNHLGFPGDLKEKYKYDPQGAKALLAQAGYASGIQTDFYVGTGRIANTPALALAVQSYLAEVGIKTTIKQTTMNDHLPFMRDMKLPGLFFFIDSNGVEPNTGLNAVLRTGGTYTKASYPETNIDQLYDQQAAEFDPAKRKALIGQMYHAFYDNASWLFLFESVRAGVISTKFDWTPETVVGSHAEYWNIKALKS